MPETATKEKRKSTKAHAVQDAPAAVEPQKILDLGNGLELWKAPPSALREQDVNARSMPKTMFERLAQTISRDKRLESLPLCAKTEKGLEIISGHHRVRAATAAKIPEVFTLVDVSGLSRSQIAAKQLAHNAIQGEDNEQLIAEIYRQIEDAESKLEAFIDARLDVNLPKVSVGGLGIELDFKTVLLMFLPKAKERFDKALEYVRGQGGTLNAVYVASQADYAPLEKAIKQISNEYDVRVVADVLGKIGELALEACGASVQAPERVHLKDIFGTTWIPKEAANVIREAVKKMQENGEITQTNRWQALEYWAADYLGKP